MPQDSLQEEIQSALVGKYTIERELPRGGMSRVFVAEENALRRPVVIKVLAPELSAGLSAERFKREITLAARLQHPHIVPLLSSGLAGPHLYYTMPFVDGESLRQRITRERQMAFDDVTSILVEVSAALAYAHEEGVVHRDIKPENVMFFHGQAVVLDFGIGKALISASTTESEAEVMHITQAGVSLGTPTYVAPEQASNDPSLDHRADIYALGIVAYEMITGHPPFVSRSPQVVIDNHARKAPEPLTERRPDVPKKLAAIVMRTLEKRPDDRPSTAAEIVKTLTPSMTPHYSGVVMTRLSAAPVWIPWSIATVMTVIAVVMSVLYFSR